MIRSPLALLAATLLGVAVLAGCGGGSKSTSQSTSAPPATTTPATSATGTTSTGTSGVLTYQQAVAICQHDIHAAAAGLVEASGLEGTCGRVVKNGATMAEVKKAILGLCESAFKAEGPERPEAARKEQEHALALCRNDTK